MSLNFQIAIAVGFGGAFGSILRFYAVDYIHKCRKSKKVRFVMAAKANNVTNVSGWVGWVYFAGLLMIVNAVFQIIASLVALFNDQLFVAIHNHYSGLDKICKKAFQVGV